MDNGTIALMIIGVFVGGAVLLLILGLIASIIGDMWKH